MTRRAVSGAFLASLTRDEGAAWGPAKSYGPPVHKRIGAIDWVAHAIIVAGAGAVVAMWIGVLL